MKNRTIIFGAGGTAEKVKRKCGGDIEIICYVDNNPDKWGSNIGGVIVYNPDIIKYLFFDKIAIAALKGAHTIKRQLLSMGVSEDEITIPIKNDHIFYNDKIDSEPVYYPERLTKGVLEKRFDIVLRYCLLKILANGCRPETIQSLCLGACEDFDSGFKFVEFVTTKILPLLQNGKYNAHQIKKLAADDKVWEYKGSFQSCRDQFARMNASLKPQLLDAYADLVENCGLFIVLGDDSDGDAFVNGQMEQLCHTICKFSLDFENNYLGYLELVKALYDAHKQVDISLLNTEMDLHEHKKLKVEVIFVSGSDHDFHDKLNDITEVLTKNKTSMKFLCSRNSNEFEKYKKSILKITTLEFLSKKHVLNHDDVFFEMLDELKCKMAEYNIPLEKIAVTSGSVMRAFGLKETDDIDIIMTSDFRRIYGKNLVIVSNCVEVHKENEFDISDDDIIYNPLYHFYYYGIKFVSLNILLRQRIKSKNKDARLIELFNNYTKRLKLQFT